jgi:hypothetical protein
VDSGVDTNPDTQGVVVGAEATVPEWGASDGLAQTLPRVDGHPNGHGTEMAMLMAAPQNGWGMVGLAPSAVHVYSIRVVPPGQNTFPFAAYTHAIVRCLKLHDTTEPSMSVINLSIGAQATPTKDDLLFVEDTVEVARNHGLNVVAAAGNDGDKMSYPAAFAPVLSVGAGDAGSGGSAVSCGFSGGNDLDITAPGCDSLNGGIDEAFEDDGAPAVGFGTSQAASLVSAVIAAMRAYSPAISAAEAELCLTSTERGGDLNVTAAFEVCGLDSVVRAGLAAVRSGATTADSQPTGGSAASTVGNGGAMTTTAADVGGGSNSSTLTGGGFSTNEGDVGGLARPRLASVSLHGSRLRVKIRDRPRGVWLQVEVLVIKRHRLITVAKRTVATNVVAFEVRTASAVRVRFVVSGTQRASQWVTRDIG